MNLNWGLVLDRLSSLSSMAIAVAAAVHLFFFLVLWIWYRRSLKTMASSLDDFTRNLKHRSVLDATSHLSDQIEGFLSDVREVLSLPKGSQDRMLLRNRMSILDEKRRFSNSLVFETYYNICRNMIEAYPLAGVLGTVLAIGSALQTKGNADVLQTILARFGDAIWSTFAGLAAAILFMFINSLLEPSFTRLAENREHARDTVAMAKRELTLTTDDPTSAAPKSGGVA